MTAGEAIKMADELRPNNSFSDEMKQLWLRQADSGLRRLISGMVCKAMMAPSTMPISKVTNMCAASLPTSCSSLRCLFIQSPMATRNSAALAGR